MNQDISIRIGQVINGLRQDLFEKEKVIRLTLLSALAGESIFLLGPPGVAKSMIARRLKFAFQGARAFEYLMGKFSTPDEVFGPVSISKLKNEDKYERLTEAYLPGAQIVFLDEIWKASPPIQNALLTVLNEKIYRNGEQELHVDIRGLIAASNELPLRGEGLEALWDRFLIRILTENIKDDHAFTQMLILERHKGYEDTIASHLKITNEEYLKWTDDIDAIKVPPHVLGVITHLRKRVKERNSEAEVEELMYISDRRWRKIVRLMRTSAFINGRAEVDVMDCFLMIDCLWNDKDQIAEARELVKESVLAFGYRNLLNIPALLEETGRIQNEIEEKTRLIRKEKVHERKVYKDKAQNNYYQVVKFWGNASAYILASDYKRLKNKDSFIPIFEKAGNKFRPFKTFAIRLISENIISNKNKELEIEMVETEKEVIYRQPPSEQMKHVWNNEIKQLLTICDESLQELEKRKALDQSHLHSNLFVEKQYAELVTQSINHATTEILNIRLEIEKTQYSYESLEAIGE